MGDTLAAIDGIAPGLTTESELLHPALERARWLAHQNRDAERERCCVNSPNSPPANSP